jgi:hypothetical protein
MAFDAMIQDAFAWLGQILLYGGGSVVIAYGAFTFLGRKWIEHKFSEQLEKNKQEQAKELEKLKLEINSIFNRVIKMQEKEFEVLPIAWERLQNCHKHLEICGLGFQKGHPNFNRTSSGEIEKYLQEENFIQNQIEEVLIAEDKDRAYSKILRGRQIDKLNESYDLFNSYLEKNRIFVSIEVQNKFLEIRDIIWELIIPINKEGVNGLWGDSIDKYVERKDDLKQRVGQIEALVRPRLYAQEWHNGQKGVGGFRVTF